MYFIKLNIDVKKTKKIKQLHNKEFEKIISHDTKLNRYFLLKCFRGCEIPTAALE